MRALLRRAGFIHIVRDCCAIVWTRAARGFSEGSGAIRLFSSPKASYISSPSTRCPEDAASAR
jgi:hypothetical protein